MTSSSSACAQAGAADRSKWVVSEEGFCHKGFYCDENNFEHLEGIDYRGHLEDLDDDDGCHYTKGGCLLRGACQAFALALENKLGYEPYIIHNPDGYDSYHVFCREEKDGKLYYIDARGVTDSFDEFMEVAKEFVARDYVIRLAMPEDVEVWECNAAAVECHFEPTRFAEAVISANLECYSLD